MRSWTQAEVSKLKSVWRNFSDRQIAEQLGRSLQSVRSYRQDLGLLRRSSSFSRWKGRRGRGFERFLLQQYSLGSSQAELAARYHIEWNKLRQVLTSRGAQVRDKSQQAFIKKFGQLPRIRPQLSKWKLYIIFSMFGDNLRPSHQTRRGTHIIGIAAGGDKDFAQTWILNFQREYWILPHLQTLAPKNIQAYVSSLDIWNDLHRHAWFGRREWKLGEEAMRFLLSKAVRPGTVGYGLRGFFDAEGSVKYQRRRAARQITLFSVNRRGLEQVSLLLDKLGIGHGLYKESISIFRRRNLVRFRDCVGFSIGRKNEALKNMISSFQRS